MAPRLDTLDSRTIYIVNVNFPLTEAFYDAILKLLNEDLESKLGIEEKSRDYFTDDPVLWAEIKEKGNGAVVGPGHMDTLGPAVVGWSSTVEKLGVR